MKKPTCTPEEEFELLSLLTLIAETLGRDCVECKDVVIAFPRKDKPLCS